MLKRLHVDNFRCLTNFEMKPGPVAALVGPNGGGKSTIFEILRALQGFLTAGADANSCFPPWSRTRWDKRLVQRIELEAEESGSLYSYSLAIQQDPSGKAPQVQEERLAADGQLLYRIADGHVHLYGDDPTSEPRTSFPFIPTRSFLPLLESRTDNQRIMAFRRWLSGVWLFALSPQAIEVLSPAEAPAMSITGGNFVSWYRTLAQESPEVSTAIREDLLPVIPGLATIRLRSLGLNSRTLNFDCELSGSTFELGLNELSDGQRILVVLYAILRAVARNASLLFFDEPDNFVAQAEIQPWLSLLRDAVVEGGRGTLLVASHSPEVIDYMAADQVLYLWRGDDGPTRMREVEVDRDTGLRASEWLKLGISDAK